MLDYGDYLEMRKKKKLEKEQKVTSEWKPPSDESASGQHWAQTAGKQRVAC